MKNFNNFGDLLKYLHEQSNKKNEDNTYTEFVIDDENDARAPKNKKTFSSFVKKMRNTLLILFIAFIVISYYVLLIPISIYSVSFYSYIIFLLLCLCMIFFIDSYNHESSKKVYKLILKAVFVLIAVVFLSNIYSLPIFHANTYANLITINDSDFKEDMEPADFSKLPVVDRSTAIKLGNRKMGEMGSLVSQYDIDLTYSQICVEGKPVRVTPLVYSGLIKWFFNFQKGIPYYVAVDMVTQNADLVKPEENIKYSHSDMFSRDIVRHIRFRYPTKIIGEINFELDEQGHPFWITPVLKPNVGLFSGYDVAELITVDAVSGEINLYDSENVPEWVDRVYPSNMVIDQLVKNGLYNGGFFNSFINQVGVTRPTDGYNYFTIGKDIYLYTGITSVLADESNIGFVFVNMRTKETKFYPVSSAEEFSVMASAQGAVQEKNYKATFPILINIDSRPTYFMSLKDNADLIKMYAFVDAQSYQKVAVGDNIQEALENYRVVTTDLKKENNASDEMTITISEITSVVINGNTVYLMKSEESDFIFIANIDISNSLAFVKPSDKITVTGYRNGSNFVISKLK